MYANDVLGYPIRKCSNNGKEKVRSFIHDNGLTIWSTYRRMSQAKMYIWHSIMGDPHVLCGAVVSSNAFKFTMCVVYSDYDCKLSPIKRKYYVVFFPSCCEVFNCEKFEI